MGKKDNFQGRSGKRGLRRAAYVRRLTRLGIKLLNQLTSIQFNTRTGGRIRFMVDGLTQLKCEVVTLLLDSDRLAANLELDATLLAVCRHRRDVDAIIHAVPESVDMELLERSKLTLSIRR